MERTLLDLIEEAQNAVGQTLVNSGDGKDAKWFSKVIAWALAGPMVGDPTWLKTVPDWLKKALPIDRLVAVMDQLKRGVHKDSFQASDVDVVITLYSLSLSAPLRSEYVDIYLHTAAKVIRKYRPHKADQLKDLKIPEKLVAFDDHWTLMNLKQEIFRASIKSTTT